MKPSREFLGNDYSSFVRRKVFLLIDALETDEYLFIRIERTRVYFDDVLAITRHQQRGIGGLVTTGILTFLFAAWSFGSFLDAGTPERRVGGFILLFIAAIFGIVMILRLAVPVDIISVFGRRTNSRVRFWLRKQRAQEIYTRLIEQIQARQQKAAAAMPPPPAPPEVPMPPPPPAVASPLPPEPPPVAP
ncbi:MAG TPA: hypothetical protein VNM14_09550 [Planctomycetota bacterium]|nr:hypothetical protein [Planctomycetota bacterium]